MSAERTCPVGLIGSGIGPSLSPALHEREAGSDCATCTGSSTPAPPGPHRSAPWTSYAPPDDWASTG